jgi:molybdenum cofactor cytidylyltransferase
VEEIVVVTGGAREQVESLVGRFQIRTVHNPGYETGEMLSSLQFGLSAMSSEVEAALIGLGDQPQVQEPTVLRLRQAFLERGSRLLVPSFQRRRGHPWLVARPLWNELLGMKTPESPRDFLNRHAGEIDYVEVDTPTILADLDTPEDYRTSRP